jgi:hypothetical protein
LTSPAISQLKLTFDKLKKPDTITKSKGIHGETYTSIGS